MATSTSPGRPICRSSGAGAVSLCQRSHTNQETPAGERLAGEAVEGAQATRGRYLGNFLGKHGRALAALERFVEAESRMLEAHDILVAALGSDHEQTTRVVGYLADLYDAWGKPDKVAEWRAKLPTEQDAVASDPPADEKQEE